MRKIVAVVLTTLAVCTATAGIAGAEQERKCNMECPLR